MSRLPTPHMHWEMTRFGPAGYPAKDGQPKPFGRLIRNSDTVYYHQRHRRNLSISDMHPPSVLIQYGPPQPQSRRPAMKFIHRPSELPPITLEAQGPIPAQTFWLQWVEAAFPDLDSRAYFLPPVYFNRVPMTKQSVAGHDVLVIQSAPGQPGQSTRSATTPSTAGQTCLPQPPRVQDSDVRDDAAMRRLLFCLQKMAEECREVMTGLSQLCFGQYLGEPCYAAAITQLPLPKTLPTTLPRNWEQGDFDVLLIHRHYGLITFEVKSFGDNIKKTKMTQQSIDISIRQKLRLAVSQLDKSEAMLSHLVSDIAPGLRITKAIAVPNLTAFQVKQAISGDTQLTQDLCRCLGTTDPAAITGLCLCSDQLSDPKTPWDVSSHVLRELGHWWQRRVAGAGHDSLMTHEVYKTLLARFCGPATTVSVPCTCPPRVSVKTLGQAVWCTGECYTAVITLFPEQLHLLNTAPSTLFVTGPPGTGKTVVLLLMGIEWLRCGHHVYIVSTWWGSRAACIMLYHLLLQTVNKQQSSGVSPGQPHLLLYDLDDDKDVEKAVNDLSQAASGGSLYVIADEASVSCFQTFCQELLNHVPGLHLWAASCFHGYAPAGWQEEYLTRPLRSPPVIVREVELDEYITNKHLVQPYGQRGVPDFTDGPAVKRFHHTGMHHYGDETVDCITCGYDVGCFLSKLRVGSPGTLTTRNAPQPSLEWRDMIILYNVPPYSRDLLQGLEQSGIPVRVMKDEDIEDVATARSDVVWVASGERVRGLERKVVVCFMSRPLQTMRDLRPNRFERLYLMSRCTAQLVVVFSDYWEGIPTCGNMM